MSLVYSLNEVSKTIGSDQGVLSRVIDIAFLFEPPFVEELISEKIATVPLHLVTTKLSNANETLSLDNYIMVDYGESVNAQHRREFQDAPPAKHYMSQPRIALNFLLDAGGSAYLPRQMTDEYIESGKLFIVEGAPVYSREIFAAYLAKSQKVDIIEQTIQLFPYITV